MEGAEAIVGSNQEPTVRRDALGDARGGAITLSEPDLPAADGVERGPARQEVLRRARGECLCGGDDGVADGGGEAVEVGFVAACFEEEGGGAACELRAKLAFVGVDVETNPNHDAEQAAAVGHTLAEDPAALSAADHEVVGPLESHR